ncbi:hypothetical protein STVA_18530 [Allostella vacuolata]|nr:hypothetical protein STVA_18530 [Stella vacuolata]
MNRPTGLRIAVLSHGGGGGSTRAAIDLVAALGRAGHRVVLVTLGRPRWTLPRGLRGLVLNDARPDARPLHAGWERAVVERIAREVAAICLGERIALLHFHYGLPFAAVAATVRATLGTSGPAIVGTLHGSDLTAAARDPILRRGLNQALGTADAVSTVSAAYGRLLQATLDLPRPACIVPNFVSGAPPAPPPYRRPGPPVLLHVSSFRAVKDGRAVARIFLAVRRRMRCRLDLAGDGPDRRALRRLLRGHGGDVRFLGFREDVPELLAGADLLLLASRAESFSLAALEAMAAGVPVVGPRLGGLPEVVGEGGLLFHPGRSADAAAKILALLRAPLRRRRMAAAARRRAGRFSEAAAVAGYESLYRLALERRASAAACLMDTP